MGPIVCGSVSVQSISIDQVRYRSTQMIDRIEIEYLFRPSCRRSRAVAVFVVVVKLTLYLLFKERKNERSGLISRKINKLINYELQIKSPGSRAGVLVLVDDVFFFVQRKKKRANFAARPLRLSKSTRL